MLLQTKGITKTYGTGDIETKVLKGVDLEVKKGEFVTLMGNSGSGKSTLMHILGMLDKQNEGTYIFDGKDTSKFDEDQLAEIRNKEIGFVFQAFNLLPRTSAIENVRLPMMYAGENEEKQIKRAKDLLAKVGLSHREDNLSNELSGGEQERVSVSLALANKPALLLSDEPTGNLDSASTAEIMELFDKLHKEDHTILVVTHEDDVASHADRIIFMKDGVVSKRKK